MRSVIIAFVIDMADTPQYIIKPSKSRMVIPKLLITLVLAIVFYAGILINVSLLGINVPEGVNILILAVLLLLVIIQGLMTYVQASKAMYAIYRNRLQIEGTKAQYVLFNAVQDVKQEKNFFDKLFKTATIHITPNLTLRGVPHGDQTFAYIQQMVTYGRNQYRRA